MCVCVQSADRAANVTTHSPVEEFVMFLEFSLVICLRVFCWFFPSLKAD